MSNTTESTSTRTKDRTGEAPEETTAEGETTTGARALIKTLEENGVETIFGIIGGAIMPIYDELGKSDTIRHITATHEQGAIHAADAYARVADKPGVVFATSGPGASNLMTGLANAYMDSSPVISVTGQVATTLIGLDSFQEVDVRGMSDPITKHNYLIMSPEDVPEKVREGLHIAMTGRRGPVLLDMPKDVQTGELTWTEPDPDRKYDFEGYKVTNGFDEEAADELAEALREAERPMILAGGGVVSAGAREELYALASRLRIPVSHSLMGLGTIDSTDPLFLGMIGMHGSGPANKAISETDLLLAVGTRLDDRITGDVERFAPKAKVAHVDLDPAEMGKIVEPDIPIIGDAKEVLASVLEKLEDLEKDHQGWWQEIGDWFEKYTAEMDAEDSVLKPQTIISTLDELTPEDTLVTTGVGQHQMWAAQYYNFTEPGQLITSGGLGTMGFGFPAAIGTKVAAPDRTVVAITGDGSFQMNIQELTTAIREDLDITVVILRNGSLGMVRQWQQLFFEERLVETLIDDGTPPLARVAEAYGARGFTVAENEDVEEKLKEALDYHDGPSVVECFVAETENVWPMVPAGAANSEFLLEENDA
ncbi:MAG: biosynthetic-type acetolactate synthase large subunit [Candidatus Bipolaricaulota bacterium]